MEKKSLKEFLYTKTGGIVLTVVVYILSLIIMSVVGNICMSLTGEAAANAETVMGVVGIILVIVWTVLGWKGLSKIQPDMFLVLPLAGWVIYFVVKGCLAMFLGMFIAPLQISKFILKKIRT